MTRAGFSPRAGSRDDHLEAGSGEDERGSGGSIGPRDKRGSLKDSTRLHLGYLHYVNARVLHYVSAPRAAVE